jgi:hypothetical protein
VLRAAEQTTAEPCVAHVARRHCERASRVRDARRLVVAFCAVWVVLGVLAAPVQARDGRFEVRSAYTSLVEDVMFLNAQIDYQLPASAESALRSGVTLDLEVQVEIERSRRFLPDPTLASLRQRYTLTYHALSDRFIVRNLNSGVQISYPDLAAAQDELGDLRDLPIIDRTLLRDDARYKLRIRAVLDRQRLPAPISTVASLFDDLRLASKWFIWRLTSED